MKIIHEGIKDHKCELCEKSFSIKGNLNQHMKSVHEGIKDHKCELCGKYFSSKQNLKCHLITCKKMPIEQKKFNLKT